MTTSAKYGSLDGCAVRWLSWEAWQLGMDGVWRETSATDVARQARVLGEPAYHQKFGAVPPLPAHAFSDGWRSPLL
jgi:hypothetical protein